MATAGKIAKPQLRGLLNSTIKFHLPMALAASVISGVIFKFAWCDVRVKKYADFYKNYDAEKEFERMRKAGVFQSAQAD